MDLPKLSVSAVHDLTRDRSAVLAAVPVAGIGAPNVRRTPIDPFSSA